jgi:hypothetical protein
LEKLEKSENPELDISIFDNPTPKKSKKRETQVLLQYCFRIHSTWGHDHTVGLTEIELYNQNGQQIEILQDKVHVKGGLGGNSNIMKLFNGKTKTTNEAHMWQTTLPTLSYLDVLIDVPSNDRICQIKVWNFNKNVNVCFNSRLTNIYRKVLKVLN